MESKFAAVAELNPGQWRIVEIVKHDQAAELCPDHGIAVKLKEEPPPSAGASPVNFKLLGCCREAVEKVVNHYGLDVSKWLKPIVITVSRSDVTEEPLPRTFVNDPLPRLVMTMMATSPVAQAVVSDLSNEVSYNGRIYGIYRINSKIGSTGTYHEIELLDRRGIFR